MLVRITILFVKDGVSHTSFVTGTNPIFLYVGHTLTKGLFPWAWRIVHPTHASVLFMNLWTTVLWTMIAYVLYRKDIIITV